MIREQRTCYMSLSRRQEKVSRTGLLSVELISCSRRDFPSNMFETLRLKNMSQAKAFLCPANRKKTT